MLNVSCYGLRDGQEREEQLNVRRYGLREQAMEARKPKRR